MAVGVVDVHRQALAEALASRQLHRVIITPAHRTERRERGKLLVENRAGSEDAARWAAVDIDRLQCGGVVRRVARTELLVSSLCSGQSVLRQARPQIFPERELLDV